MSGDTPIYDAVCRAVGSPPHEDGADAEQTPADDPATAELSSPVGDPPRDAPAP